MFQVSMTSDEDILKLKDLPIWFTHAKTDPVVVPDDFVVPTYERLAKVNPNAHFTYWDKVLDHTGTQKMQTAPHSNTSATGPGSRC